MDEIVKLIATPSWWISTVAAAFLVNVAAAYAKPIFDGTIASWSTNRKKRLEEENERDDAVVMYLITTPQSLVDARTDATFTALRLILALTLAVFWTSFIQSIASFTSLHLLGAVVSAGIYFYFIASALRQFRRFRGLRRIIDKCSKAVHTYDEMPIEVVKKLERERDSK